MLLNFPSHQPFPPLLPGENLLVGLDTVSQEITPWHQPELQILLRGWDMKGEQLSSHEQMPGLRYGFMKLENKHPSPHSCLRDCWW